MQPSPQRKGSTDQTVRHNDMGLESLPDRRGDESLYARLNLFPCGSHAKNEPHPSRNHEVYSLKQHLNLI